MSPEKFFPKKNKVEHAPVFDVGDTVTFRETQWDTSLSPRFSSGDVLRIVAVHTDTDRYDISVAGEEYELASNLYKEVMDISKRHNDALNSNKSRDADSFLKEMLFLNRQYHELVDNVDASTLSPYQVN